MRIKFIQVISYPKRPYIYIYIWPNNNAGDKISTMCGLNAFCYVAYIMFFISLWYNLAKYFWNRVSCNSDSKNGKGVFDITPDMIQLFYRASVFIERMLMLVYASCYYLDEHYLELACAISGQSVRNQRYIFSSVSSASVYDISLIYRHFIFIPQWSHSRQLHHSAKWLSLWWRKRRSLF